MPIPTPAFQTTKARLEKLIANASDADLERAYKELEEFKNKYPNSLHNLMSQPFAYDVMTLIDEQYRYRNQMGG